MKMKSLYNVLAFMFIAAEIVWSDAPIIELETEGIMEFKGSTDGLQYLYRDGEIFLSHLFKTIRIDPVEKNIYRYNRKEEIETIVGEFEGKYIIKRAATNYFEREIFYIYDPDTGMYEELTGITSENSLEEIEYLFQYSENKYIGTYKIEDAPITASFDRGTGMRGLENGGVPGGIYDVSPDGIHAINYDSGKGYRIVKLNAFDDRDIVATILGQHSYLERAYFITNDLIGINDSSIMKLYIYSLSGENVLTFHYKTPENGEWEGQRILFFNKIENSKYGFFTVSTEDGPMKVLVKTSNELDYLDEMDLLFHPTIGTVNDRSVDVRKWPLLDNEGHLGFLNKGDKLEILDRSGIRVTIDGMTDYWYKVLRISDGLEGWSYGYYIDLVKGR